MNISSPLIDGQISPEQEQNQALITHSATGSDNPDDRFKPPFSGPGIASYSYWIIPVIRYLISVNGDSILLETGSVVHMLPILLPVIADWWNAEERVVQFTVEHNETPAGDPVFLFEQPVDMDGGGSSHSDDAEHNSSTSTSTGSNGSHPSGTNDQPDEKDEGGDELSDNNPPPPEATNSPIEQTQSSGHDLQKMLTEKIEAQDGISVFCLLCYCKADPNGAYQGKIPLLLALQTGNKAIIHVLYEFGARPNLQPRYKSVAKYRVSDLTQLLIYTIGDSSENGRIWLDAILDVGGSCLTPVGPSDGWRSEYYGACTLGVLLSSEWDGYPSIREQVFNRIAQRGIFLVTINFKLFRTKALRIFDFSDYLELFVRVTGERADNRSVVATDVSFGLAGKISVAGFQHLLQHVKTPFTTDTFSLRKATKWRYHYCKISINSNFLTFLRFGLQNNLTEGAYFALLFAGFSEELAGTDVIQEIRLRSLELAKQENINLNSLMVGSTVFFEFICRYPEHYSQKTLVQLILSGLVPVFAKGQIHKSDSSDRLLKFVFHLQEKSREHRYLSYQCFTEIDMTNNQLACLLPPNIFLQRFRWVVEQEKDWEPPATRFECTCGYMNMEIVCLCGGYCSSCTCIPSEFDEDELLAELEDLEHEEFMKCLNEHEQGD